MYRNLAAGVVAIVAGCLVLVVGLRATAQPARENKLSPVGVWDIRATDTAKTKWIGTLVLTTEKGGLVGHVDWSGSGGEYDGATGRERVTATFDAKSRRLTFRGEKLEHAKLIVLGNYTAEMTEDGTRLESGKMEGEGGSPGEWSARRILLKE